MLTIITFLVFGGIVGLVVLVVCFRQVPQGMVGVVYSGNKAVDFKNAGWRFVMPVIQRLELVETKGRDLESIKHDLRMQGKIQ